MLQIRSRSSAQAATGDHRSAKPAGGTNIVELDADPRGRWGDFVRSRSDALIYHHPLWLRVLADSYGFRPLGLGCEDMDGALLGVLPLCYTRGILTRRTLSSLPRTPVAGPLAINDRVRWLLMTAAVERARREGGVRLELKVPETGYTGAVRDTGRARWDPTYIRNLSGAVGELRFGNSRNHAQIKRAVSKSQRLGVEVRAAGSEADLRRWYDLYLRTLRRHGVPPRPYRFFQAAWRLLSRNGMMRLLLAEQRSAGRLLAGSVFFSYGNTTFFAFNGTRDDALPLRPNDAIHWQAIHDAYTGGTVFYDLGEVDASNEGLARFKTKWGAEPAWLYRYYYPADHIPAPRSLDTEGYGKRLARMAWRRVPVGATAVIGDWLYRYL